MIPSDINCAEHHSIVIKILNSKITINNIISFVEKITLTDKSNFYYVNSIDSYTTDFKGLLRQIKIREILENTNTSILVLHNMHHYSADFKLRNFISENKKQMKIILIEQNTINFKDLLISDLVIGLKSSNNFSIIKNRFI